MRCTTDHEKVERTSYDGESIRIDAPMVALVDLLMEHRISVRNACEGTVLFIDQTHYEARPHRAEVRMIHDEVSLAFVRGLMVDSHFFEAEKILWDIRFDRVPGGPRKDERRITICFPPQDTEALITYIKMKEGLAKFRKEGLSYFEGVS